MIPYLKGDMFNSPAKIPVNTVNTVGVMGKGKEVGAFFQLRNIGEILQNWSILKRD